MDRGGVMQVSSADEDEQARLQGLLGREPSATELARYHRHRLRLLMRHHVRRGARPITRF